MTSQGQAYARFRRAIQKGETRLAMEAAWELRHITLEDALSLCLVLRHDKRRYQHAAARWLARYHADVEGVTLTDIRETADLMAALVVHGGDAAEELAVRFEGRGLHRCARAVREVEFGEANGREIA